MKDDLRGQGVSQCNKCGALYPSAPAGTLHKCGACSGGMCSPISDLYTTPAPSGDLVEIAAGAIAGVIANRHGSLMKDRMCDARRDEARAVIAAIEPQIAAKAREDERVLHTAIAALGEDARQALVSELNDTVRGWEHYEPEVNWIGDATIAGIYRALLAMIERKAHRENGDG